MKHPLFSEFTVHMHLPKIPLIVTNAMIGRTFWVFLVGVPLMRTKNSLLHSYNVLLREYNFYFIVYILSDAVLSIAIARGVICDFFQFNVNSGFISHSLSQKQ